MGTDEASVGKTTDHTSGQYVPPLVASEITTRQLILQHLRDIFPRGLMASQLVELFPARSKQSIYHALNEMRQAKEIATHDHVNYAVNFTLESEQGAKLWQEPSAPGSNGAGLHVSGDDASSVEVADVDGGVPIAGDKDLLVKALHAMATEGKRVVKTSTQQLFPDCVGLIVKEPEKPASYESNAAEPLIVSLFGGVAITIHGNEVTLSPAEALALADVIESMRPCLEAMTKAGTA